MRESLRSPPRKLCEVWGDDPPAPPRLGLCCCSRISSPVAARPSAGAQHLQSGRGAARRHRGPSRQFPRRRPAPRPRNFATRKSGGVESGSTPRPPPAPRWARTVFLTQEKWQILSTSLIWRQKVFFFF